jgi:beta-lactamase regulating signal transducer with metallopeptidase domain
MDAFSVLMQAGLGRLALATLQSLPLAGLVWLLCRALPRLGAAARCWLWWLVALQLVLGLCWPNPLRLPLLPAIDTHAFSTPAAPIPTTPADLEAIGLNAAPAMAISASAIAATPNPRVAPVTGRAPAWMAWTLWFAWLTGVAMMALRSLADLRVTRARLRASSAAVPPAIAAQYLELSTRLGLRQPPPLRLCAQLDSPQLAGVWSPQLLLPAQLLPQMSAAAIEMALHHELVHWQRRDLLWGWVPALAQHLFFFHPLAHVAAREYALAREAACDAAVLNGNRHAPQDYGRLLLQFGVAPRAVAVVGAASPNFVLLKRRLTMLQSRSVPWRAGAALLVAAVALVGVLPYRVVAAAPQAEEDADPAQRANLAAAAPAAKARPAGTPTPAAVAAPAVQARVAVAARPTVVARAAAGADWMPAPPAPPAPPTAPVPLAPMAPTAPLPPRPPAAPATPTPGAMRGTFSFVDKDDARTAWVLMDGDHVHAFGTPDDLRSARKQQRSGESMWWLRQGDQRYVVRDPAALAQLRQAYAPLQELSRQQSELGAKQGALGGEQGELGARQGELGARQSAIAARIAQLALEQSSAALAGKPISQERQQQAEREQQALSQQMEALAREQQAIGERQGDLGRQQGDLGKRQEAALDRLRALGDRLGREAIASGKAQRI